jgi:hypothetical protein
MASESLDKFQDTKTDEKGKQTFAEKMRKRQKDKKAREKESRNSYNLLKRYLIFLIVPFIFMGMDIYLLFAASMDEALVTKINNIDFYVYGTYLYVFLLPITITQELLNYIGVTLPMHLILETTYDTFVNYNFFTLNPTVFSENLHELIDAKYYFYESSLGQVEAMGEFSKYLALTLFKLYLFGYLIFFIISKFISNLLGVSQNVYGEAYDGYKKFAYGRAKNADEIKKNQGKAKKFQKILLSTKGEPIDYLRIYKDSFEQRNAVFCAIFGGKLFKDKEKKYELFNMTNEVFDSYIPNKYYNIINFMSDVDKSILNIESEVYEDTLTQKKYTADDFDIFLNHFKEDEKRLIIPTFVSTLRKYRTFDVHNLIRLLLNNEKINISNFTTADGLSKIKRMSKDAYKILNAKDISSLDAIGISIQVRYPFDFTLKQIKDIEETRELTKLKILDMKLKYLSSDENMKLYDMETESTNETAKEYYDKDFNEYIGLINNYTTEFFKVSMLYYPWLATDIGTKYIKIIEKLTMLNFNTNYWLEDFNGLNSSHFKTSYIMEDELSHEQTEAITKYLNTMSEDVEYLADCYTPEIAFLKHSNMGIFVMLSLATNMVETIPDNLAIISFQEEFISFYKNLSQRLLLNNEGEK